MLVENMPIARKSACIRNAHLGGKIIVHRGHLPAYGLAKAAVEHGPIDVDLQIAHALSSGANLTLKTGHTCL
jgi:hypothetical protein